MKQEFTAKKLTFQKKASLILTLFGLLLIFWPSLFVKETPVQEETSSFADEKVNIDPALLVERERKDSPVRLLIPDVNIEVAVKEAEIIKGYWQTFPDTAGFGLGSAYPGELGNQVIFAHARKGLFINLKDIKQGVKIYVLTNDHWYSYEVKEIKEVLPTQVEVIAPTLDETLTLYTCTGFTDQKRLIVTAKRSS